MLEVAVPVVVDRQMLSMAWLDPLGCVWMDGLC